MKKVKEKPQFAEVINILPFIYGWRKLNRKKNGVVEEGRKVRNTVTLRNLHK